jgi:hypothetical protein
LAHSGFSQNPFEKQQLSVCCFSKELWCKSKKLINQQDEGNYTWVSSKKFCKFEMFWCEAAKNLIIEENIKGRVRKSTE